MRIGIFFLCAWLMPAAAQIPAPESWRKESFDFPLAFAPSIPYVGKEHVRFAPQWAKFDDERGFTYVVLWDIARRPGFEAAELERALNVYFDGLMEQVTRGRKIADPGTVTNTSLHPLATPAGWQEAYGGRVFTWNGFSRGEALALYTEISHRSCGADRTQVFLAFSRTPRTHPAWEEMRAIRKDTQC